MEVVMEKNFTCERCGIKAKRNQSTQKYCSKCSGPAEREKTTKRNKEKARRA